MEMITLDKDSCMTYRPTPWDTRVFGFKTNEILDIRYPHRSALDHLLDIFDRNNRAEEVQFTYTRIDAGDKLLRHALQSFSFYYAETSFALSMNDVEKQDFGARFRNDLQLTPPDSSDYDQIKTISRTNFHYSRFHDDFNIEEEKARDRYYLWIDDLREQGKRFLVYKTDNVVKSFLAYDFVDDCVDLILAGSKKGSDIISFYFWPSFMTHFQKLGYKKAKTIISASNIGIVNLYARLNFKFERTMLGYHKMYQLNADSPAEW